MAFTLAIVFIGPAGSGKTSLSKALGEWIERNEGLRVAYVNLDPAVEILPYIPHFDARTLVRARDLMVKEGLGPNGAIVKSIDLLAEKSVTVHRRLARLKGDILIVDTPGQSESFIFRPAGPKLLRVIRMVAPAVGVYVTDPTLGLKGTEAAIALMMSLVTQLRLDIDTVPVINKIDLVENRELMETYHLKLSEVKKELEKEGRGVLTDIATGFIELLEQYMQSVRVVAVSAKTGEGLDELYKLVHETFCTCGDLS